MGDINNDGYPDIIVLNYEPHDIFIWKNQSPQNNNWIKIKLILLLVLISGIILQYCFCK